MNTIGNCPFCQARLSFANEDVAKNLRCPTCERAFLASDAVPVAQIPATKPPYHFLVAAQVAMLCGIVLIVLPIFSRKPPELPKSAAQVYNEEMLEYLQGKPLNPLAIMFFLCLGTFIVCMSVYCRKGGKFSDLVKEIKGKGAQ